MLGSAIIVIGNSNTICCSLSTKRSQEKDCHFFLKVLPGMLYQINGIRRFLVAVSIARHGDLALQIPLIAYYKLYNYHIMRLRGGPIVQAPLVRQYLQNWFHKTIPLPIIRGLVLVAFDE